jgi:hypothetical protein
VIVAAMRHGSIRQTDDLDVCPRRSGESRTPRRGAQHTRAKVQHPLVAHKLAEAHVERLVINQEPDDLAVGHVDRGRARLRVAVASLGVRHRARLVETVEIAAGEAVGFALIDVCLSLMCPLPNANTDPD